MRPFFSTSYFKKDTRRKKKRFKGNAIPFIPFSDSNVSFAAERSLKLQSSNTFACESAKT